MKKLTKIFITLLASTCFALPAHAAKLPFQKLNLQGFKNNSNVLFTLIITTSDGKKHKAMVEEFDYVGKSVVAPCGDLSLLDHEKGTAEITPGQGTLTADDLKDYPGLGYTCLKMDLVVAGKRYSTGNITLKWDEANQTYIDANPKVVTINFVL